MAMKSSMIVALALALIVGGILGEWWRIEDGILRLGDNLRRTFRAGADGSDGARSFAYGFLNASLLFCVGAMAIVGSFKAGTEGDYTLIFTKSVLDGAMAIVFAAAQGVGVAFSALAVLVYQGALTLLAGVVKPFVTDALIAEITGVGGALLLMIGINLLGIARLKTANYLPSIVLMVAFVLLAPLLPESRPLHPRVGRVRATDTIIPTSPARAGMDAPGPGARQHAQRIALPGWRPRARPRRTP